MIYIYGDSHAEFSFKGLMLPHKNRCRYSTTMFRVGRDNSILNYNKYEVTSEDIVCLAYGEVDCRCHIQRQINLGKNEDEVISELVTNYFDAIKNNIKTCKKIIVTSIIPPTCQSTYEALHGPIPHEYPFVGSDEDRVRFTYKMNKLKESFCAKYGYIYFNPYEFYTNANGTLKHELSDKIVHIGKEHTKEITEAFTKLI
jgi:hypothetical protein